MKSKFIVSFLIFLAITLAILTVTYVTFHRTEELNARESIAERILLNCHELSELSNDYLLFREARQQFQWDTKYNAIATVLAELKVVAPEDKVLVAHFSNTLKRLRETFDEVHATLGRDTNLIEAEIDVRLLRLYWARLAVQTQELIHYASQVSRSAETETHGTQYRSSILIMVMIGLLILFVLLNYLFAYWHVLRSLTALLEGTRIVGEGNLDYRIEEFGKDEMGDLARAFNQMNANLKTVLASKEELNYEVEQRKRAEEAIRESEEHFRLLVENAPIAIFVQAQHQFVYLNPLALDLFGAENADQLLGQPVLDRFDTSFQELVKERIHLLNEEKTKAGLLEEIYLKLDGSPFDVEVSAVPIPWAGHNGAMVFFRDITEFKKAQEALKESNERYRQLIEVAPVGIAVHSEGKIVFTNPSGAKLLGGDSEEQIVGKPITEIIHPDRLSSAQSRIQRMLAGEKGLYPVEEIYLKSDGTPIAVEVMAVPLKYQGKPAVQVIVTDITAAQKAEETQRRLATAIYQATEGVIITDTRGTIQYVNPAIEQITGYDAEELMGNKPSILKSGEHDALFYHQLWSTITAGNTWSGRFMNRRKDGQLYYEDATITPVKDASGNILNFVAVKRDVTEHLELSKQLIQAQKMEAVGTLAAGVAHDFNNLLQVVLGYSEFLLGQKQENDPVYKALRKIHEAGKRGADLVQNLMMFSRKVEPKLRPVNLNDEVVQVQKLLTRTIPKTIKINLRLSGDLEFVEADISQIGQVLMNLGVNARDAMPDGGTLTIGTRNVELDEDSCTTHLEVKPGRYVVLEVSDSGHGMNKETLSHIFEPFFSTKEAGKGTGLGLATVHGIIKQHKGHITCYSELGHGTTFKIYLPAIQPGEKSETQTEEMPIQGGTETILLVDDEESLRDLGGAILEGYGYHVLTAGDGQEALETYKREHEKISLVILDLIMPEMDGRQCLGEILRMDPKARVVIASGYSNNGPITGTSLAGAKDFVEKPYNMRQLLRKVRNVLNGD